MFNRFSRSARDVIIAAVDEAKRRGDKRIGTEHLLLGLLHEAGSPATRSLDVDLESARHALRAMDLAALAAVGVEVGDLPEHQPAATSGRRPFTAAARAVLGRTVVQAQRSHASRLDATHLLLALLDSEPRDPARQLLEELGVDAAVVRSRLTAAA